MSSDRLARPWSGQAAGVPYVALPPTAVDAEPSHPAELVVALHGLEPPRSAAAFAAAVPMTGVPVWRVYLELPMCGSRLPSGGADELRARARRDYLADLYAPVVEQAVAELPQAVAEVREDLELDDAPIGLVGFSAGGAAALLALAEGSVEVGAVALIAPTVSPVRLVAGMERHSGSSYTWTDESRQIAERLDVTSRALEIVAQNPAFMLIAGASDALVTPADIAGLRDLLRTKGAERVEAATVKMAHALAAEPGTDPVPPIAEAVSVDAALTDWFRDQFAVVPGTQAQEGQEPVLDAGGTPPEEEPVWQEPPSKPKRPRGRPSTKPGAAAPIPTDA